MKSFSLLTAGAAAGLGLASVATAQDFSNQVIFADGGTVTLDNGTMVSDASAAGDGNFVLDQSITLPNTSWYTLDDRVVALPGVTVTIEKGTVFASVGGDVATGDDADGFPGTLIIAPGAQLIAEGDKDNPIIFTSLNDLARWEADAGDVTGQNRDDRGVWFAGFAEWGSIAWLGDARIGDDRSPAGGDGSADSTVLTDLSTDPIEGLPDTLAGVAAGSNIYGGFDDKHDGGVMKYVTIAYGGDNFDDADNSELNGMSFGGLGRETDVSHIEILNNIDDGLEIFGGTVNIKCLFVWNIGDDSLDIDQGWRAKAQFVLIVQGAAGPANQGSGFGDNGFEVDGFDGNAEGLPVTACSIYNMTIIGAPEVTDNAPGLDNDSSDHLMAFRDNANVQFFNCLYLTTGDEVLVEDNASLPLLGGNDDDGSTGYGAAGTLTFAERWDTNASFLLDVANTTEEGTADNALLAKVFDSQDLTANLLQISGSLFFGNPDDTASDPSFNEAVAQGVVPSGNAGAENVALDNLVTATQPIVQVVRAASVGANASFVITSTDAGDGTIANIIQLDPRAAGEAVGSTRPIPFQAEADGFLTTPVSFRGAVSPFTDWLQEWTAISAIRNADPGGFILTSPARAIEPGNVALDLAACISFDTVKDCFYEVVCIDAEDNEFVVDVVEGTGATVFVTDPFNKPVDASKKYIVRIVTH